MNPELWKLIAAIGGLLVTAVTGPIIWAIRAEAGKWRAQLELMRAELKAEIAASESRLDKQITLSQSGLERQIAATQSGLEKKMTEMETRLNERIDTRLVHR